MRRHGTHSCYVGGCRCEACSTEALRYAQMYYWRTRKFLKVPSDAAREHVLALQQYGLGDNAIAASCGAGPATIRRIRLGKAKEIYQRTEQRIFSVTPEGIADGALVDASVTHSLLHDLLEEGWTRAELNRALGRKGRCLITLYRQRVTAATEMRVEQLYRRAIREGLQVSA